MREALGQYLEGIERVLPSSIGVAEDAELAGRDVERWLEERWQRDLTWSPGWRISAACSSSWSGTRTSRWASPTPP